MSRYWTNHIKLDSKGFWFVEAMEWEWDYDEGAMLSDIDEPGSTAGLRFETAEAAFNFCRNYGIRVSNYSDISSIVR